MCLYSRQIKNTILSVTIYYTKKTPTYKMNQCVLHLIGMCLDPGCKDACNSIDDHAICHCGERTKSIPQIPIHVM